MCTLDKLLKLRLGHELTQKLNYLHMAPGAAHFCLHFRQCRWSQPALRTRFSPTFLTKALAAPSYVPPTPPSTQEVESDSLDLLEWPLLCQQVACFAQTTRGAQTIVRGGLPMGRDQAESEILLEQTFRALNFTLKFKGVYDISQAISATQNGQILIAVVLGAILTTLETGQTLLHLLKDEPVLLEILEGLGDGLKHVTDEISRCLRPEDGYILNRASNALATARARRRQNTAELSRAMDEWARKLHSTGASERFQVVVRRGRLCIPVKVSRKSDLPKGSVSLATSASGSTVYMEPEPLIIMNNNEATLAAIEEEEETKVLQHLSLLIAQNAGSLYRALSALTQLDIISARAKHAAWVGATRPMFVGWEGGTEGILLRFEGALHPILMEPSLPPLPSMIDFVEWSSASNGSTSLIPELMAAKTPSPLQAYGMPSPSSPTEDNREEEGREIKETPRPIDITISHDTRVVAVTGPNTGGKTASLKTLGLLCLMAKAGLFLPNVSKSAQLVWFDKVIADVGDGQSLQQSLSTFSGHIRRVRGALVAATSKSLVLLDEVGSGTDPTEGAALACTLLLKLAKVAGLTYVTSHHAEVKELATVTPGFVNVSAEFDPVTLRPTYKLLWGVAGNSNALSIAQGLGFNPSVIAEARLVAKQLERGGLTAVERASALKASIIEESKAARAMANLAVAKKLEAEGHYASILQRLDAIRKELDSEPKPEHSGKLAGEEAKRKAKSIQSKVSLGEMTVQDAVAELKEIERIQGDAGSAALALYGLRSRGGDEEEGEEGGEQAAPIASDWQPQKGDRVQVPKMGGAVGTVVSSTGNRLSVKVGTMALELQRGDVVLQAPQRQRKSSSSALNVKQEATEVVHRSANTVAIQTSGNTLDLRGRFADDAASELNAALIGAVPGDIFFVIHGVGTGKVREAVMRCLKTNGRVLTFEEAENSKGGCTMVTVK